MPDAFDTLGLEPRLDLSAATIRAAYMARLNALGHEHATTLNAAKGVLLDTEQRAGVLLARLGGPSASADRSLPAGFLIEMMQAREDAEAAIVAKDAARVEAFVTWAERQRDGHVQRLRPLLITGATTQQLALARRELNAWRYIERMIEQLTGSHDADGAGAAT